MSEQAKGYDYEDVTAVAFFAMELAEVMIDIRATDGGIEKARVALRVVDELGGLLTITLAGLKTQWASFQKDKAAREILFKELAAEFNIADDKLEARVEKSVAHVLNIVSEIEALIGVYAK